MENFTPKQIGVPDSKLENAIATAYTDICDQATAMFILFERLFGTQSDPILFIEFVNLKNPKDFLYQRFIEINQIHVPGLSIDKIVELDLIDVPRNDFAALIEQRKDLLNMIEKVKEYRFFFPLAKLFRRIDEEISDFAISYQSPVNIETPEFDQALYYHIRKFTKNQEENVALESINKIIEGLNDLVQMGVIRNNKLTYRTDLEEMLDSIVFASNSDTPLSISPKLALKRPFTRKFKYARFENANTFGKPADILKVEAVDNKIVSEEETLEEEIFESE